ncbi:hypothetical protein L6452_16452 [Arctium lappa]|uniref:Uncharacterized protein n=1 Tax=Arctium lappa TaxID=4217 RepID=A0ACB9C0K9_ARCLA|nr:hypothetical protein L6452_16452 [Arctium lappa]
MVDKTNKKRKKTTNPCEALLEVMMAGWHLLFEGEDDCPRVDLPICPPLSLCENMTHIPLLLPLHPY